MKNKKRNIIILIIIVILAIIGFFLFKNRRVPYVEEKKIEVSSAKKKYTSSVYPYAVDKEREYLETDAITFDSSKATYEFFDYSASKPDKEGNITYKFKYSIDVPISFTIDNNKKIPNYNYTYMFGEIKLFDYYTGKILKSKKTSQDESVNISSIEKAEQKDMKYTKITWGKNTYKIGSKTESKSTWGTVEKNAGENNTTNYKKSNKIISEITIYAPEDYDGIMIALNKKGVDKDSFLKTIEETKKYEELKAKSEETGEKSKELIEYEKENKKTYKLLERRDKKEYANDTFYVVKLSDIKKAK